MNRASWASPSSAASSVAAARVASRYSSASGGSSKPWSRVTPANEQPGHRLGRGVGVEQCGERGGTAQQQVAVVLPGEADASVHLDVQLRVPVEGGEGERGRGGGGELEVLGVAVRGATGVPHRRGRELGGDEHVGAVVLHRLEHRDRPPELQTVLGVRARGFDALLRATGRLGGGEGPRHLLRDRERAAEDRASRRPGCP